MTFLSKSHDISGHFPSFLTISSHFKSSHISCGRPSPLTSYDFVVPTGCFLRRRIFFLFFSLFCSCPHVPSSLLRHLQDLVQIAFFSHECDSIAIFINCLALPHCYSYRLPLLPLLSTSPTSPELLHVATPWCIIKSLPLVISCSHIL